MSFAQIIEMSGIPSGEIILPASKSISNRVLILKFLSRLGFSVSNLSQANDTRILNALIQDIGNKNELFAGDAGTVLRFMTAALSITPGEYVLFGSDYLNKRPVGPLVDALRQLKAGINYLDIEGFPPLKIKGKNLKGGNTSLYAGISSQMISSLMLIAPFLDNGLHIELRGAVVSLPYINMTRKTLNYFGVQVLQTKTNIKIPKTSLLNKPINIESDWSAASFFYLLTGLWEGSELKMNGLLPDSWQGDRELTEIAEKFGVKTNFRNDGITITNSEKCSLQNFKYDLTSHPDLAPPLAVWCTLLKVPFELTGLESLKIKESNRIEALTNELQKIGANVIASGNSLLCKKFEDLPGEVITIKTYNDHRITMSFAIAATKVPNLVIEDMENVSKSFPGFWDQLRKLRIKFIRYEQ